MIAYHTGDSSMNAAKKKANQTLPRFLELMDAGTSGTATVKFPLTQNGETEHIWMQLTGYRDGTFTGLLANDPVNGAKYKMGDAYEGRERRRRGLDDQHRRADVWRLHGARHAEGHA